MRTVLLMFALATGFGGFPPALDAAGRCNHPGCTCKDCDTHCKCCSGGCSVEHGAAQAPGARFAPMKTPVTPEGIRVTADLPPSQQHRNAGGMGPRGPGTGAGLCVFTSIWHAAEWQNVKDIYPLRDWMQNKPGGGWPEKVDAVMKQFCQEKGVPIPGYVQHTGGDTDFLKTCLKTGRMVCVTYAGMDDFYRDRWGRPARIAHMVNLVYLDDKWAAILDNNRPGVFVRMSAQDFTERWMAMSGGWAIVFTAPPPPPYARKPAQEFLAAPPDQMIVGPMEGEQPEPPIDPASVSPDEDEPLSYSDGCKRAKELGVPLVTFVGRPAKHVHGCVVAQADELKGFSPGDVVVSKWVDGKHRGVRTLLGLQGRQPGAVEAANMVTEVDRAVAQLDPKNKETISNFGVDFTKITRNHRFSINGRECDKRAAVGALSITDDSTKYNLAVVGDPAYLDKAKTSFGRLSASITGKVNAQYYLPTDWPVAQFGLKAGLNMRDPDAPVIDRVGKSDGELAPGDLTDDILLSFINAILNPPPPKPAPPPVPPVAPKPDPKPSDPAAPTPTPQPRPNDPAPPAPQPQPTISADSLIKYGLVVAILVYLFRNRISTTGVSK